MNAAAQHSTALVDHNAIRREITSYLQEPVFNHDSSPLMWCHANQLKYTITTRVARDMLYVQATSVPSVHLFSKAGNVTTKKRHNLAAGKPENLIFLMENM